MLEYKYIHENAWIMPVSPTVIVPWDDEKFEPSHLGQAVDAVCRLLAEKPDGAGLRPVEARWLDGPQKIEIDLSPISVYAEIGIADEHYYVSDGAIRRVTREEAVALAERADGKAWTRYERFRHFGWSEAVDAVLDHLGENPADVGYPYPEPPDLWCGFHSHAGQLVTCRRGWTPRISGRPVKPIDR
jgi:hypothetical protein